MTTKPLCETCRRLQQQATTCRRIGDWIGHAEALKALKEHVNHHAEKVLR